VQGVDPVTFRQRFTQLVQQALQLVGGSNHIIIVTIPDFSVTPTGQSYSNGRDIKAGLTEFNHIMTEVAAQHNIAVVDIFALSQAAQIDTSLVAPDGLHPSDQQYTLWEQQIFPVALQVIQSY
jgi:lysophospholipase L1-like esterase